MHIGWGSCGPLPVAAAVAAAAFAVAAFADAAFADAALAAVGAVRWVAGRAEVDILSSLVAVLVEEWVLPTEA